MIFHLHSSSPCCRFLVRIISIPHFALTTFVFSTECCQETYTDWEVKSVMKSSSLSICWKRRHRQRSDSTECEIKIEIKSTLIAAGFSSFNCTKARENSLQQTSVKLKTKCWYMRVQKSIGLLRAWSFVTFEQFSFLMVTGGGDLGSGPHHRNYKGLANGEQERW